MNKIEITNQNYTETCADLICAFAAAIDAYREDAPDQDDLNNAALDLATACGWDWKADDHFTSWALKATGEESLVEGLQKALAVVCAQYDAFIASNASNASKGARS